MVGIYFELAWIVPETEEVQEQKQKTVQRLLSPNEYTRLKPDLGYREIYPEPIMRNLESVRIPGPYSFEKDLEKIILGLRYANITTAVENRYSLPRHSLLAILITESAGDEFAVSTSNARGLCQIIENTASMFGVSQDEILHRIINIDCAGRLLAYNMSLEPIPGLSRLKSGTARYYGENNENYQRKFQFYMENLSDPKWMSKLEHKFNTTNEDLIVNGNKIQKNKRFKTFIAVYQQVNYNYELKEYLDLPLIRVER